MTKQICAACTLVLIFFISGCLYIPPLSRQTGENDVRKIQVGVTTKQELIELLGEPEILDEGRFSLCDAFEGYGVLIWFAGGMDLMDFANKYYLLLFEFDENNVLKKYQIEGDTVQVFPDKPTSASQVNSIRKLLFEDRVWRFSELTRFKAVAFSPVGTSVAALDQYDHVWLHNIETGEQRTFSSDGFDSLTFSPNGRTLALVGYIVRIVDVSTGSELVAFDGHVKPSFWTKRGATALAFSPDGRIVATGGHDGAVKLWDSATCLVKRSFDAHDGEIVSIEFSPDGKMIASVGWDKTVCIWETSTGIELATLRSKRDYGKDPVVKFSPDGGTLAVHRGYHVELWKVAMKESSVDSSRPELSYHLADVFIQPVCPYVGFWKTCLAFSPDGHTIVASAGTAVMFDITTSSLVWRFVPTGDKFRNDGINGLAFSPDGKSLTAATNNGVYLWEFQRGE